MASVGVRRAYALKRGPSVALRAKNPFANHAGESCLLSTRFANSLTGRKKVFSSTIKTLLPHRAETGFLLAAVLSARAAFFSRSTSGFKYKAVPSPFVSA